MRIFCYEDILLWRENIPSHSARVWWEYMYNRYYYMFPSTLWATAWSYLLALPMYFQYPLRACSFEVHRPIYAGLLTTDQQCSDLFGLSSVFWSCFISLLSLWILTSWQQDISRPDITAYYNKDILMRHPSLPKAIVIFPFYGLCFTCRYRCDAPLHSVPLIPKIVLSEHSHILADTLNLYLHIQTHPPRSPPTSPFTIKSVAVAVHVNDNHPWR